MSIERRYSRGGCMYTPTCDSCGDTLAAEYDFDDAVDAMKREGWNTEWSTENSCYENYCPDCQEERKVDEIRAAFEVTENDDASKEEATIVFVDGTCPECGGDTHNYGGSTMICPECGWQN